MYKYRREIWKILKIEKLVKKIKSFLRLDLSRKTNLENK